MNYTHKTCQMVEHEIARRVNIKWWSYESDKARERKNSRERMISSRCAADALEKLTGLQLHSKRQHKSREFMLDRARWFFVRALAKVIQLSCVERKHPNTVGSEGITWQLREFRGTSFSLLSLINTDLRQRIVCVATSTSSEFSISCSSSVACLG